MSREIKFRAWFEQKMIPAAIINNCKHPASANSLDFETMLAVVELLPVETPLMQYTGLKDKNGKEIYEGDILQDGDTLSTGTIIWIEESASFGLNLDDELISGLDDICDYEVIGNIYEKPELLNT